MQSLFLAIKLKKAIRLFSIKQLSFLKVAVRSLIQALSVTQKLLMFRKLMVLFIIMLIKS